MTQSSTALSNDLSVSITPWAHVDKPDQEASVKVERDMLKKMPLYLPAVSYFLLVILLRYYNLVLFSLFIPFSWMFYHSFLFRLWEKVKGVLERPVSPHTARKERVEPLGGPKGSAVDRTCHSGLPAVVITSILKVYHINPHALQGQLFTGWQNSGTSSYYFIVKALRHLGAMWKSRSLVLTGWRTKWR